MYARDAIYPMMIKSLFAEPKTRAYSGAGAAPGQAGTGPASGPGSAGRVEDGRGCAARAKRFASTRKKRRQAPWTSLRRHERAGHERLTTVLYAGWWPLFGFDC